MSAQSGGDLSVRAGHVELLFTRSLSAAGIGEAFIDVPDVGRPWKQLRYRNVTGMGPVEEGPSAWRQFVLTDPDGNRLHVRSATVED